MALNCQNFNQARHAVRESHGISHADAQLVLKGLQTVYPKVELFSGEIPFGVIAQNLEGCILRKVLLKGVKENVFALPIHDAVAVELDDMRWACNVMSEAWEAEISGIYSKAKASVSTTISG